MWATGRCHAGCARTYLSRIFSYTLGTMARGIYAEEFRKFSCNNKYVLRLRWGSLTNELVWCELNRNRNDCIDQIIKAHKHVSVKAFVLSIIIEKQEHWPHIDTVLAPALLMTSGHHARGECINGVIIENYIIEISTQFTSHDNNIRLNRRTNEKAIISQIYKCI